VVVLAHVWACPIIAHVMQALRLDVALRADVDPCDVSLRWCVKHCLTGTCKAGMASWSRCITDAAWASFDLPLVCGHRLPPWRTPIRFPQERFSAANPATSNGPDPLPASGRRNARSPRSRLIRNARRTSQPHTLGRPQRPRRLARSRRRALPAPDSHELPSTLGFPATVGRSCSDSRPRKEGCQTDQRRDFWLR